MHRLGQPDTFLAPKAVNDAVTSHKLDHRYMAKAKQLFDSAFSLDEDTDSQLRGFIACMLQGC